MDKKQTFWIHPASFTYRLDEPERLLETIWAERPGWGYLRRRDLWIKTETSLEEIVRRGYVPRKPLSDEDVHFCSGCGLYMCSIPGSLVQKHFSECRGSSEDWSKIERAVLDNERMKRYEAGILAQKLREQAEREEMEKRERFDKIREDMLARQEKKDRKKRLKQETKEDWKNR